MVTNPYEHLYLRV